MANKKIEKKDEVKKETKKTPRKTTGTKTTKSTTSKKSNTKTNASKKKTVKKVELEQIDNKIEEMLINETKPEQSIEEVKETKEKTKFGIFEYVLLLIIISLIFSLLGYFIGLKGNKSLDDNYVTVNKELREFIEEYNYILENYYGEVDESKLISNAIEGMLSTIDNYSGFIDNGSNNNSISLK